MILLPRMFSRTKSLISPTVSTPLNPPRLLQKLKDSLHPVELRVKFIIYIQGKPCHDDMLSS
jgi:hypothetical protein